MKFRAKIAIFLVAALITLVGFNLIASPLAVGVLQLEGVRGQGILVTVTAGLGPSPNTTVHISG